MLSYNLRYSGFESRIEPNPYRSCQCAGRYWLWHPFDWMHHRI